MNSLTDSFCSLPLARYSIALGLYLSAIASDYSDLEAKLLLSDYAITLSSRSILANYSCLSRLGSSLNMLTFL